MKKSVLIILLVYFSFELSAQQDPLYSQYMFNMSALNPAYVGSHELISSALLFRKQFVGIAGSPTTATFGIDAPFWNNKLGGGLLIVMDKIGKTQTLDIATQYAYRIRTAKKGNLALGLQAGISQYAFRGADLQYSSQQNSGNTFVGDPTLEENINRTLPNVGTGLWFNNERFYAGFSVPRLINYRFSENQQGILQSQARQFRHVFATTGYVFDLNAHWQLKPSLLLRAVEAAAISYDLNANLYYQRRIGLGVSYRNQSAVVAMFDFQTFKGLRISYAYDFAITPLARQISGSHEIMIRFQMQKNKKEKKEQDEDEDEDEIIISPRLF
ncbi:MAG: type IX secretion system membrane protein PorP/SprF [Raineya sp.]